MDGFKVVRVFSIIHIISACKDHSGVFKKIIVLYGKTPALPV